MRKIGSFFATKVLILLVLHMIYGIFVLQDYLEAIQYPHATTIAHVCQAGLILLASRAFHTVSLGM